MLTFSPVSVIRWKSQPAAGLLEGGTELGALPEWFGKSPTAERLGTPDALSVVILSVDGDPNFGTFTAFLHAFGVPWAIVCDGSLYRFGTRKRQIFEQVLSACAWCLAGWLVRLRGGRGGR